MRAFRNRASQHMRYNAQLLLKPHRVTRKEFWEIFNKWREAKDADLVSAWIGRQAERLNAPRSEVEEELFEAVLQQRQRDLSRAADSIPLDQCTVAVNQAMEKLQFIRCLLIDLQLETPERAGSLLGRIVEFAHFDRNEGDRQLRQAECSLAMELFDAPARGQDALAYLEVLRPWSDHGFVFRSQAEAVTEIQRKCLERIIGPACQSALTLFTRPEGIKGLRDQDSRSEACRYCLLSTESPLWRDGPDEALMSPVRAGRDGDTTWQNCLDYLELLFDVRGTRPGSLTQSMVDHIVAHHHFIANLWRTVTSKPIQFRLQWHFLELQRAIVKQGVPEDAVPLTSELKQREAMEPEALA